MGLRTKGGFVRRRAVRPTTDDNGEHEGRLREGNDELLWSEKKKADGRDGGGVEQGEAEGR